MCCAASQLEKSIQEQLALQRVAPYISWVLCNALTVFRSLWLLSLRSSRQLQEQYINDRDFLLSAVEAAGLPRAAAADVLDSPDSVGEKLVQQELGKYPGITGVPHFVINGR